MRVFVTGATGFAGSHLVDGLLADGHEVFALVHGATSHQALPDHPRVTALPGENASDGCVPLSYGCDHASPCALCARENQMALP